jgi:hypothetical protein
METLKALIPSAGVVFIFWLAIRGLIQADRRERAAQARIAASRQEAQGRVGTPGLASPTARVGHDDAAVPQDSPPESAAADDPARQSETRDGD